MLGTTELGPLSEQVTEFTVPSGRHLLQLKLGAYHSVVTRFHIDDDAVLDLRVVENPDAILPVLQGGYIKLERVTKGRVHGRGV
jgi:hypothetical protein